MKNEHQERIRLGRQTADIEGAICEAILPHALDCLEEPGPVILAITRSLAKLLLLFHGDDARAGAERAIEVLRKLVVERYPEGREAHGLRVVSQTPQSDGPPTALKNND